ncbi:hypothetical protein AB0I60_14755 [Actinosynnema sp. NPDC050436]|uniref:hypothetical protein n=1 Tax=Actinosynnema sp. NPDC050436 TaxID=3155659 RepID=UPI0033CCCF20
MQSERFGVERFGLVIVGEQATAAQHERVGPRLSDRSCPTFEAHQRFCGTFRHPHPHGRLDQVGCGTGGADVVAHGFTGQALEAGECRLDATQAEVQQSERPVRPRCTGGGDAGGGSRQPLFGVSPARRFVTPGGGEVGEHAGELADPLLLAGVAGELEGLGRGGQRVTVPPGEHLALGHEEQRCRQPSRAAPRAVFGGERGCEFVGVDVLAQRECRAAHDHQHLVGRAASAAHRCEGVGQRRRAGGTVLVEVGQVRTDRREGVGVVQRQCGQLVQLRRELPFSQVPGGVDGLDHHRGGLARIGGADEPGTVEQQAVGGEVGTLPEVRERPDLGDPRAHRRVLAQSPTRAVPESPGAGQVSGFQCRFRCQCLAAGLDGGLGAQAGGSLVGRRSRLVPTALACAGGGVLQRGGGLFVGPGGGGGQVPGPTVRVLGGVQGVGERAVHGKASPERCPPVDGGTDQRVAEADRGVVGVTAQHQAGLLGGGQVLDGGSQRGTGAQDRGEFAGLVGRRHQQQVLARRREPADLAVEGQVQAAGEGQGSRRGRAAALGREGDRQFQQRQRVAVRFGEQPVAHGGGERVPV